MRALLVAYALCGCNEVHGLDETKLADPNNPYDPRDYDLDGENNFTDDCPSLANADQADRDGDGVGDVCDPHPDTAGDRIAERTFFADPRFDVERWNATDFEFVAGAVVDAVPLGTSMLRSKRSYEQRYVVIEVVFAASTWNTSDFDDGLTIFLDDFGGPSINLHAGTVDMVLVPSGPGYVPDSRDQEYAPSIATRIPIRMRLVYDRQTLVVTGELGALRATIPTTFALPKGPVFIVTEAMAGEIYAVVVYVVD